MTKHPCVLVVWEDHHERINDTKEWSTPTPPDKLAPVLVSSVGFIVSENMTMIELARDVYEEDGAIIAGGLMRILKKCIVSSTSSAA